MSQLWQARFFTTVNHLRDLPSTVMPEIAFAGRSNAGKSTAINILCNQKKLAFASKTPGRTQHINYFSIGGAQVGQHRKDLTIVEEIRAMLVDLPGYGYAEVSGSAKLHWQKLLGDYVQHRTQLAALVLIIDCRRPMTDLDIQMLEWFAPTGKPIHVMLTKSDKLNRNDAANALREARTVLSNYVNADGSAYPFSVQLFSALKRSGIEDADARICTLVGLTAAVPATHDAARTATVISSDGIATASVATEAPALTNIGTATAPAETTVVPPVAAADTSSQDNGQDNSQDDGHDAPKTSVKKSPEERGLSSGQ